MKKMTTILLATVVFATVPQMFGAQERASGHDARFIRKAAEGNNAEIQTAQMVLQRTQDPQIRTYAEKLIRDHTQANAELQQIAQAKGIDLPAAPKRSDERSIRDLEGKSGVGFDRAVVDHWVKDHQKDIKEYRSEANHAKDPQVQQYASSALPVLQDHLNGAEQLRSGRSINEAAGSEPRGHNYKGRD
jgi:putative membrane protein